MRWSVFEWKVLSVYNWLVRSAPRETIDRDFDPDLAIVGHARVPRHRLSRLSTTWQGSSPAVFFI